MAEFEKNISPVTIDRFIQFLGKEEQGELVSKMVDQLSDVDRVKNDLWKDLIQRYFGCIRGNNSSISLTS
uniref:Pogo family transposase n=1 Tax=Daphnia magna TaxID=35525 RepID=A0A0P6I936_9CRUS